MLSHRTIRPGLLVSLKTSVVGNVHYDRRVIDPAHTVPDGSKREAWETEKTTNDPKEHERACEARSKAQWQVRSVCAQSDFGLLCPEEKEAELQERIAEARKIAAEFNASAAITRLDVFVVTGRVAQDDVEAVRAINSEVRGLMEEMQKGIAALDVKAVRAAASKAKSLGQMLTPEAAERIQVAIDVARKSARDIVKAGEQASTEVDRATIDKIAAQRTMFLDLDDAQEIVTPTDTGRAVDFAPEASPAQ